MWTHFEQWIQNKVISIVNFRNNKFLTNHIYFKHLLVYNRGNITKSFSVTYRWIYHINWYISTKSFEITSHVRSHPNNSNNFLLLSCTKLKVKPGSFLAKNSNINWLLKLISSWFITSTKVSLKSDIANDIMSVKKLILLWMNG